MMRWSVVAVLAIWACGSSGSPQALSIVVYTRENQWSHPSRPVAADALRELSEARDWNVTVSDDPAVFTPARLASTDVVVFSVTSGNVLDEPARAALERFFTGGGGFVGTHSASSTEHDWPFYKQLVPATFKNHPTEPQVRDARLTIEAPAHPIVGEAPDPWLRADEWYTFHERPEELGLTILLALDESSLGPDYIGELAVGYHPLAWTNEQAGLRAFYTALGHTPESYAEPAFMGMLERGILWAGAAHHARRTR